MDVKSALIASVPGHHGVVAEGDPVVAVVDLGHELHRGKELGKIDPLHPVLVVVADDQVLNAF